MNIKHGILSTLAGILLSTFSFAQQHTKDYLGIKGPVQLAAISYQLVWSSHPMANYFKQEYLPKGDTLEHFKKLVLVEVLIGPKSIKSAVAKKIAELDKLKETNPIVKYEVFEKDGEIILDFLLCELTPDGEHLEMMERNVYRYKSTKDAAGKDIIVLFAASERAYGDDIMPFLQKLKVQRELLFNAVGAYPIPAINIKE
ncbi:hypothetical protein [Edaphocola aurantiacus]|uniref:hypothetical protein n=1 Tax=Edaphocola aurantiacus TaxID=2601682 RepID=UPI001C93F071|nr:hypothetical protein [Edaphocola aurantiacus]